MGVEDRPEDSNLVMWGGDTSPRSPDSPKRATKRRLEDYNSRRPLMADERQRLASFKDFPVNGEKCNPRTLAAAGFFHSPLPGHPDGVSCFSCGLWLSGWDPDDDPAEAHEMMDNLQRNDCKFLKELAKEKQADQEEPLTIKGMLAAAGEKKTKKLVSSLGVPGRQVLFQPDKMRELFDGFDINKNGSISREEFKETWRKWEAFGIESDKELDRIFSQFDSHNREDESLTFQEFQMLILQRLKM